MSVVISIILTLIILSIVVVIHEWGHFIVAKLFKVNVEEFACGMGPKIVGKKWHGTEYTLRWLPVGGYCKMTDNIEDKESKYIGYNDAALWKRTLIAVAGPFMNFVLAIIIITIVTAFLGFSSLKISESKKAARKAGIQAGDTIVAVDGHNVSSIDEFKYYITAGKGQKADITVKRQGQKLDFTVTPYEEDGEYLVGVVLESKAPLINIMGFNYENTPKANIFECMYYGTKNMFSYIKLTFSAVGGMFTGKVPFNQLSGPIGMVGVVDNAYKNTVSINVGATIVIMLEFAGLISVSLGIINLLPLPALDGGRIIIYLVEMCAGRELPEKVENAIHIAGFVLLMGLGIVIAVMDVMKYL
ncbi:MAG: site-2 protease family protein [Firmicutes bacterium]|nr:site-2 protease family protein [Bacillota bacterium]